jgi:hypothetical protein
MRVKTVPNILKRSIIIIDLLPPNFLARFLAVSTLTARFFAVSTLTAAPKGSKEVISVIRILGIGLEKLWG